MELPSIIYCIICVRLFYKYLEDKDFDYLLDICKEYDVTLKYDDKGFVNQYIIEDLS